jgi:lipoprotein-releasing system ATP-binding protein
MNRPPILLCDEPTGNLDRRTAEGVRDLLWDLNRTERQSMILVTHDAGIAGQAHRTLTLVDGRLDGRTEAA